MRRQSNRYQSRPAERRRGIILVFAAILLVMIFGFLAFTIDVGYMTIVKAELQNAADAAAMAGAFDLPDGNAAAIATAKSIALENDAGNAPVVLLDADIEIGLFDFNTKTFTSSVAPNAIRVTTRVSDQPCFFASVLGTDSFDSQATAIAMLNPRDIVFVVDTSGSMNDDTEPVWATETINALYGPAGYPGVATPLVAAMYTDFGFGTYPGTIQFLGSPLGVANDDYAYAEMTKDDGPLTSLALDAAYRIENSDSEETRRLKAYRWIIDYQLASIMPNAKPALNSSTNFDYWSYYIDYVVQGAWVGEPPPPTGGGGGGGGGGGTPSGPSPPIGNYTPTPGLSFEEMSAQLENVTPFDLVPESSVPTTEDRLLAYQFSGPGVPRRGATDYTWTPPSQDGDRIYHFNNPNLYTFPGSSSSAWAWRNHLGYYTYLQFLLDWGRDRSPDIGNSTNADPSLGTKTQLSYLTQPLGMCPMHSEATAGGTFSFPPREQPMHATRRALIAALQVVKEQNAAIASGSGDRVAVISFDALDAYHSPQLRIGLTSDYDAAMGACTTLQAVSDIGTTTAIEAGLIAAQNLLKPASQGGQGRDFASKVVVLLTDGVPNVWQSTDTAINDYIIANPNGDYYGSDYVWYNSALTQAAKMAADETQVFAVGVGLGADYDFMDRLVRLNGTDESGQSPRGTGNPAEYEERTTEIFVEIIKSPGSRLVN